jgi:hypothetical protein
MARFRTRGVPRSIAAALVLTLALGACSSGAGPSAGATSKPTEAPPGPSATPGSGGVGSPAPTVFDGMLVTISTVEPIVWYGQRCDPVDPEWLVTGQTASAGYEELWSYTATIDPGTLQGTYVYEAHGEIAGGTITKTGTGGASVLESDGTATLTVDAANVTGTIVAGGTTQTVMLPVPSTAFTFRPAPREDCP